MHPNQSSGKYYPIMKKTPTTFIILHFFNTQKILIFYKPNDSDFLNNCFYTRSVRYATCALNIYFLAVLFQIDYILENQNCFLSLKIWIPLFFEKFAFVKHHIEKNTYYTICIYRTFSLYNFLGVIV